jgi:hypothetical protein
MQTYRYAYAYAIERRNIATGSLQHTASLTFKPRTVCGNIAIQTLGIRIYDKGRLLPFNPNTADPAAMTRFLEASERASQRAVYTAQDQQLAVAA